jgi:hypothetical protein
LTANFRLSVGDTIAFAWCDELSRWRDDDAGANPAEQVVGSLKPALATLPNAKLFLVSSPLGVDDYHAKQFDRGDTADQCVAFGTTWDINPTLTEAECRLLEPDEKLFAREYAAQPQGTNTPAFNPDHIAFAIGRRWPDVLFRDRPIGSTDFSSGRGDDTIWSFCAWKRGTIGTPIDFTSPLRDANGLDVSAMYEMDPKEPGRVLRDSEGFPIFKPGHDYLTRPQLCFGKFEAIEGKFFGVVPLDDIVAKIASQACHNDAHRVVGDQREDAGLEVLFRQNGVRFESTAVTLQNKQRAVTRLRRLLADKMIILPHDETLKTELQRYREVITATGNIRYTGKRSGGDDRVACILNALIAEDENLMPGSPIRSGTGRRATNLEERI